MKGQPRNFSRWQCVLATSASHHADVTSRHWRSAWFDICRFFFDEHRRNWVACWLMINDWDREWWEFDRQGYGRMQDRRRVRGDRELALSLTANGKAMTEVASSPYFVHVANYLYENESTLKKKDSAGPRLWGGKWMRSRHDRWYDGRQYDNFQFDRQKTCMRFFEPSVLWFFGHKVSLCYFLEVLSVPKMAVGVVGV